MPSDDENGSSQPRPPQANILCARCGGVAAEFLLVPPQAVGPDDPLGQRGRLVRRGFMGQVTLLPSFEQAQRLFETILGGDLRAARGLDPDTLGFYCPDCDAPYCERCWNIGPPIFDDEFEGFYDYTKASCPKGHTHIVDD